MNRSWLYQGETINGVVADSYSLLGQCGLRQAQLALQQKSTRPAERA